MIERRDERRDETIKEVSRAEVQNPKITRFQKKMLESVTAKTFYTVDELRLFSVMLGTSILIISKRGLGDWFHGVAATMSVIFRLGVL